MQKESRLLGHVHLYLPPLKTNTKINTKGITFSVSFVLPTLLFYHIM